MKDIILDKFKQTFRPEFLNRIDDVIVFKPLGKEEIAKIVYLFIDRLRTQLKSQGMDLIVTENLVNKLGEEGFNPTLGARPLRRAVQHLLEDTLAEEMLQGNFREGDLIHADYVDNKVVFTKDVTMPEIAEAVTAMQN
jgi:ATP-dependent Clp protease ATP-binding subunit ClpC